jgi:hypothetical protein
MINVSWIIIMERKSVNFKKQKRALKMLFNLPGIGDAREGNSFILWK